MNCPNPNCGYSDESYAENFGKEYAEAYPLFRYFWRDNQFWIECVQCGTEFRPSKTLNGLEIKR